MDNKLTSQDLKIKTIEVHNLLVGLTVFQAKQILSIAIDNLGDNSILVEASLSESKHSDA